ncbi:hypothetical protein BOSE62_110390 [Bosea sp. 62]|nr:hypothetical protein BOSE21B_50192 [Bosea sp. 21B]CAD5287784.1 hypothetical protein BOSE46_70188 [Bosea sp. 46]CAD5301559.1 hypothetical protein BOSE7B_90494 [Bosea sp. 7B]VVT51213.1 hypothetical protein BOS5A_110258 [Bosea sp. EC-HK365B]VXB10441.1 hypothetical protein BOSE62_110390 [Bosea sp. 62]VXB71989.1 hypothetical protein BOSE127_140439 [Bosea sp. 127]VXC56803.1 hypothetical protein BOSE29B_50187 [Bosea sp. 29B]VXC90440.1 hypothetical protein BOSE125_70252 [Bosea sp. 125]
MSVSVLQILVLLGKEGAEPIEASLPEGAALADPALRRSQCLRVELAGADPPDLLRTHQPRSFQNGEMLHHRRQRHLQGLGKLADARRPLAEPLHHLPAVRVRQRLEHQVELLWLVKHALKYLRSRALSSRNFRDC